MKLKRYQVYLDPHSINTLDEVSEIVPLTRSRLLREAISAAASRVGNLLAIYKPPKKNDYSWLDGLIGSITIKGKKTVNLSENVDEIYYK